MSIEGSVGKFRLTETGNKENVNSLSVKEEREHQYGDLEDFHGARPHIFAQHCGSSVLKGFHINLTNKKLSLSHLPIFPSALSYESMGRSTLPASAHSWL